MEIATQIPNIIDHRLKVKINGVECPIMSASMRGKRSANMFGGVVDDVAGVNLGIVPGQTLNAFVQRTPLLFFSFDVLPSHCLI